ncbi:MAG: tetratricopeptide repeat protein [Candidatus Gastranaerophilales bacterium]|nr:tetratricopeptide repeat protein [Candidatus Gastranaerophilales bacterium]
MGITVSDNLSFDKVERFAAKPENKREMDEELAYRHLIRADALRLKNYFWEAIAEYLTYLDYDDTNIDAYIGLGFAYKQIGCVKKAIESFNKAKKLNSFDKRLYFEVGCCYCIDCKFNEAIVEYKKALKICPDFLEAKFNLAFAYELNNQSALAIELYKKILDDNPGHAKSYNHLGNLCLKEGKYTAALRVFRKMIKHCPESPKGYLGAGICFDKLREGSRALRYYRKYLKFNPVNDNLNPVQQRIAELRMGIASGNDFRNVALVK